MPDEIDRLVDQETMLQEAAIKAQCKPTDKRSKELLDQHIMTKSAAVELTNQIKSTATATYALIYRAHEYKCWVSLDYKSWEDYVVTEFDMSKARSYQLINQAKVVRALEQATPDGTVITINEAQARDIEKVLPKITERIKAATAYQTPNDASKTVINLVEDARKDKKAERENRQIENAIKKASDNTRDTRGISLFSNSELDKEANKLINAHDKSSKVKEKSSFDDMEDNKKHGIGYSSNSASADSYDLDDDDNFGSSADYILMYVASLGDPKKAAESIQDPEKALVDTKRLIKWFTSFKDILENKK